MVLENDELMNFGKKIENEKPKYKFEKIEFGDLIKIDYTITLENGIVVDTSIPFEADHSGILDIAREYQPLKLIVGKYTTIPGLEKTLVGMKINETKTFKLKSNEGFGEYEPKNVRVLSKDLFPNVIVGEQVVLKDDKVIPAWVKKIDDEHIYLDLNHPLAGKELVVNVRIIDIIRKNNNAS